MLSCQLQNSSVEQGFYVCVDGTRKYTSGSRTLVTSSDCDVPDCSFPISERKPSPLASLYRHPSSNSVPFEKENRTNPLFQPAVSQSFIGKDLSMCLPGHGALLVTEEPQDEGLTLPGASDEHFHETESYNNNHKYTNIWCDTNPALSWTTYAGGLTNRRLTPDKRHLSSSIEDYFVATLFPTGIADPDQCAQHHGILREDLGLSSHSSAGQSGIQNGNLIYLDQFIGKSLQDTMESLPRNHKDSGELINGNRLFVTPSFLTNSEY